MKTVVKGKVINYWKQINKNGVVGLNYTKQGSRLFKFDNRLFAYNSKGVTRLENINYKVWQNVFTPIKLDNNTTFLLVDNNLFLFNTKELYSLSSGKDFSKSSWLKVNSFDYAGNSIIVKPYCIFKEYIIGVVKISESSFIIVRSYLDIKEEMIWEYCSEESFGSYSNIDVAFINVFNDKIFVGTNTIDLSQFDSNEAYKNSGVQIWSSSLEDNTWKKISEDGFGSKASVNDEIFMKNQIIGSAINHNQGLYVGTNSKFGCELWKYNGANWQKITLPEQKSDKAIYLPSLVIKSNSIIILLVNNNGNTILKCYKDKCTKVIDDSCNNYEEIELQQSLNTTKRSNSDINIKSKFLGNNLEVYKNSIFLGCRSVNPVGDKVWMLENTPSGKEEIFSYKSHLFGENSNVEGYSCNTLEEFAHAEGFNTLASGKGSHAEGGDSQAHGVFSHAEGYLTNAYGDFSHAEGILSKADGDGSHVEGFSNSAYGMYSHAEGSSTTASGNLSHTEGSLTEASGYMSHAEGKETKATGMTSHSEGINTIAKGIGSHAEGSSTNANSDFCHVEGEFNTVNGISSHGEGKWITVNGNYAHGEGVQSVANGEASHAEGYSSLANGWNSHAEGYRTIAYMESSHAEGADTLASGENSHAEGNKTESQGSDSHAEGSYSNNDKSYIYKGTSSETIETMDLHRTAKVYVGSLALGKSSHAENTSTYAIGDSSHAEGDIFTDEEGYLHVTVANGHASHAEGIGTYAKGTASHTQGAKTIASGSYSHASGLGTIANQNSQTVIGKYNLESYAEDDIFVIGNGISEATRSNAFKFTQDGKIISSGKGELHSAGTDYGEMFEWYDGNVENEDRIGYFVSLEGDKIRRANISDKYILGIVSGTSSVISDAYDNAWKDVYMKDEWGRIIYDTIEIEEKETMVDGGINMEKVVKKTKKVPRINPLYNSSEKYISRSDRKEWSVVGLIGKILVRDDGTCEVGKYCLPNNDGIATKAASGGYRVLKRTGENQVLVLFK